MPGMATTQLVIIGETEDGQTFRPNDWTERLIDAAGAYGQERRQQRGVYAGNDRRRQQTAFLTAQMLDGRKCLVIDLRLQEANPGAYAYLMAFVRNNRLRTRALPDPAG